MTDAWFAPDTARMFSLLSLLALTAALKPLAVSGRARAAVLGIFRFCFALGVALMLTGLAALTSGQPDYVVRTLLGSGVVVAIPFLAASRAALKHYTDFEMRKTIANDL